jgi:hypothetical protein
VCYDFKERTVVPTHYAIRTHLGGVGSNHLKFWLVETSLDGSSWREVDHRENTRELNGPFRAATFPVAAASRCRFIRLVGIGRDHARQDSVWLTAWEIFGGLFE